MNRLALLVPLLLAACGGDAGSEGERKTAAGEVLGGTISDDMLPLDTVTSQSPPLREGDGDSASERPANSDDTAEAVDSAQPTPGPAPTEPATPATAQPAAQAEDE